MSGFKTVSLGFLLFSVLGCDKKAPPAPEKGAGTTASQGSLTVGSDERTIAEMRADEVIVAVNGVALKRKDYDALLLSLEQLYRAFHPTARATEWENQRKARTRSLVSEFMTKQLLVQEARRRGLKATPESRTALRATLEKYAKKQGLAVDELATSSNPTDRIVFEGVEDQALIQTLRESEFGDKLKVTEADLEASRKRIALYNEMCEKTNAVVKVRAAAIVERLRKGEDFTQVALQTSEYKGDEKGVWGTFARGEIGDALVRNAAFSLPVGAVSEPFDTEDGMVIIKVLERSGVDSPASTTAATVKLGRILLLLGETQKVPDDKALRGQIEQARLAKLQGPWLAGLHQKARIEFPHGTNLLKKAKSR